MNLIPIKPKITIDKWITSPVKYDDTCTLKDILNDYVTELYSWLQLQSDFNIVLEKDKISNDIINIIYKNQYTSLNDTQNYEYFCLKFNEDIYDIYSKYYNTICIDIGHNIIKNNYMIIFDYIYDIIEFNEEDDLHENLSDDY